MSFNLPPSSTGSRAAPAAASASASAASGHVPAVCGGTYADHADHPLRLNELIRAVQSVSKQRADDRSMDRLNRLRDEIERFVGSRDDDDGRFRTLASILVDHECWRRISDLAALSAVAPADVFGRFYQPLLREIVHHVFDLPEAKRGLQRRFFHPATGVRDPRRTHRWMAARSDGQGVVGAATPPASGRPGATVWNGPHARGPPAHPHLLQRAPGDRTGQNHHHRLGPRCQGERRAMEMYEASWQRHYAVLTELFHWIVQPLPPLPPESQPIWKAGVPQATPDPVDGVATRLLKTLSRWFQFAGADG